MRNSFPINENPKIDVFILGIDGYLGYSLALYLKNKGYTIAGMDNFSRRNMVTEVGGHSAIPIDDRKVDWDVWQGNVTDYDALKGVLQTYNPKTIVHFAEQPSAPYSMIDWKHASFTHINNVVGTLNVLWAMKEVCPEAHLIKLGTMGEYGTPNIDIPEGFFTITYRGRKDTLPFPKQAGSWYHQTKVHDSNNIIMACKIWGLRSTDINQGPVYGVKTKDMDLKEYKTRFDFDGVFGTALNRFVAQALIEYPLTVYGKGGQTRGYLHINDSMEAIEIAIKNPPKQGEYRVFNQWAEKFSINELADIVIKTAKTQGLKAEKIENPRIELEKHYYNPDHQTLYDMGWKPRKMKIMLPEMFKDLKPFVDRIEAKKDFIKPNIKWK